MHRILFLSILLLHAVAANAQIGVNILHPDTSAVLQLESTTRGFLPPRLTRTERDAVFSPKPGLQIYNTTDSVMQYYNGECWLSTWQRNCNDCGFNMALTDVTDSIDRIFTNTCTTTIEVEQYAGNQQNIALFMLPNLPFGMTANLDTYVINGTGSAVLTVNASIFTPPGTYTIIIQGNCGGQINTAAYIVTVLPCIEVDITSPQLNYNLQVFNSLPTNVPICVVAHILPGITVVNDVNAPQAFEVGTLHPQSQVGILNDGSIFARGGEGAFGGNLQNFGNPGANGTNALSISTATSIINNGQIYSGGGGGGSVGVGFTIPIINWNIGIGAGGGGGAADAPGGLQAIPLPIWADGQSGTGGINGLGGQGGNLNAPIPININPVVITVTPNVNGGDGGNYGVDGTSGNLFVNLDVQLCLPIIGCVSILNINLPDPPVTNFPPGGTAGNAIKRNGNPLIGVADGYYNALNLKGRVGN